MSWSTGWARSPLPIRSWPRSRTSRCSTSRCVAGGGLGGARATLQSQRPGARKAATVLFVVAFVGFGVAMPIGFLVGNHANADSHIAGLKLTRAEKRGQMLFGENCGVCHTLAA